MLRSRVIGTGSHVPEKVLTNLELEKMVETSDEWIATRTGIKERRIAVDESTSDMASKAAKAALKASGLSAKDIDLIVVGTVTGEMAFPSTACFVQSQLGVRAGAAAFDVSAACSGFLYALDVADKYLKCGAAKTAIVVGVDRFSKLIDWTESEHLRAGSNQTNRIGLLLDGERLSLFANGNLLDEISDDTFDDGKFGVFIGSVNTEDFKVRVDEIAYWSLP